MLLEFACSNHKSIRGEVLFSALAGKDNTFEEKTKEIPGGRVLKSAIIYGANGAGKSNLVNAIAFVKDLVTNSISHQPGQGIRQTPHKLDGFEKDSVYRIQFIDQDVRYVFGFSLRNMLVSDEYLYYFPNNRQTKIRTAQIFHLLLAVISNRQNRRKALKSLGLLRNQNHPKLSSFIRCYP